MAVSFENDVAPIKKFPLINGVTTNDFGDFGFFQSEQWEIFRNGRLKKIAGASNFFKIAPNDDNPPGEHGEVKIIAPEDYGKDKYYKNCNGLIYINNMPDDFLPVLISLNSPYPTVVLTNKNCGFISIFICDFKKAGERIVPKAINLIKSCIDNCNMAEVTAGIFLGTCANCFKEHFYSEDSKFNFSQIITDLLKKNGVREEKIHSLDCCCFCSKTFSQKSAIFIATKPAP